MTAHSLLEPGGLVVRQRATRAARTMARWAALAAAVSLAWAAEVKLLHAAQGVHHSWLRTWAWTAAGVWTWAVLVLPVGALARRVRGWPPARAAAAHLGGLLAATAGYVALRAGLDAAVPGLARRDLPAAALLLWYVVRSAGPVALAYAATVAAALVRRARDRTAAAAGSATAPAAAPAAVPAAVPAAALPAELPAAPAAYPAYRTHFEVPAGGVVTRVPVASVAWIEAAGNYVYLHVPGGRAYLLREPLRDVLAALDPAVFRRVHRSAAVAVPHVADARRVEGGGWRLVLRGGGEVPVSRRADVHVPSLLQDARQPPA